MPLSTFFKAPCVLTSKMAQSGYLGIITNLFANKHLAKHPMCPHDTTTNAQNVSFIGVVKQVGHIFSFN